MKRTVKRIFASALLIAVVLFVAFMLSSKVQSSAETNCWKRLEDTARIADITFSNMTSKYLSQSAACAEGLENLGDITGDDAASYIEVFNSETASYPTRLYLPDGSFISEDGYLEFGYKSSGLEVNFVRKQSVSSTHKDFLTGKKVIEAFSPVMKNGEVAGIVSTVIDLSSLSDTLASEGTSFMVADRRDGTIIIDTKSRTPGLVSDILENEILAPYSADEFSSAVTNGQSASLGIKNTSRGVKEYIYAMPSENSDYEILSFGDEDSFFAQAKTVRKYIIAAMAVLLAASVLYMVFTFKDTREELAEEKKHIAKEYELSIAQKANKAKSTFLFNLSHDIRTPMNAIEGYTAIARKYIGDQDKVESCLEKIDVAEKNLLELINQILDMTKLDSGTVELHEESADILERLEALATIINPDIHAKGIRFQFRVDGLKNRYVYADCGRTNQILLNILGNAIKYTPEGGEIQFTVSQGKSSTEDYGNYIFTCTDNGIGMSGDYVEKIFEPFSREQSSTISKIEGTGLGMSIVKNLVDMMNGKIDIESAPGEGTTVRVALPFRLLESEVLAEVRDKEINPVPLQGKRVLIIEDNEMNREIAKLILEDNGIIVEEAENGKQGLEKVRKAAVDGQYDYYDFILMDIQMPVMDGYEATREIRAIPAPEGHHVPIIAMTANVSDEDKQKAFEAGMDDHLAKPIEMRRLLETLLKYVY